MRRVDTFVDIDAPIETVWRVLIDISNYGAWNPFIVRAIGVCLPNELVSIRLYIPGKGFQNYRVCLTTIEVNRHFGWLGHFYFRGLIDGLHRFELTTLPNGQTRVRQYEDFNGLLVPFVWRGFILRHLQPCFEMLNFNLKAWCEGMPLPVPLSRSD